MDFSKDLTKRLDDLVRSIDQITERVDTLSADSERHQNTFKSQFQQSTRDLKDSCDRVRSEVIRLSREVGNMSSLSQRYSQQAVQGGQSHEQLAWSISQAVSQSIGQPIANAVRQALTAYQNGSQPSFSPQSIGGNA